MGILKSLAKGAVKGTWYVTKGVAKGTIGITKSHIQNKRNKKLINLAGEEIRNSLKDIKTISPSEELEKLGKLFEKKLISKQEFLEAKERILSQF